MMPLEPIIRKPSLLHNEFVNATLRPETILFDREIQWNFCQDFVQMFQTPQLCKQELSRTIKKHYSDGGLQYSGSKLISQLSAALNQMIKVFLVE